MRNGGQRQKRPFASLTVAVFLQVGDLESFRQFISVVRCYAVMTESNFRCNSSILTC